LILQTIITYLKVNIEKVNKISVTR